MNIIIFGAGAIGSLFGALLSKNNNVLLIGKKPHVTTIQKKGLIIEEKTHLNVRIMAESCVDNISFLPDLLILTVKSYDTETAILQARKIIIDKTIILSLQNGLDNIEKISKHLNSKRIIPGVTTHGAFFSKPGVIKHTGKGMTILGELNGKKTKRIEYIVKSFNEAGIETAESQNILKEIWIKAIINSSINPLTAIFQCKNGFLLKNPLLEKLVEMICEESTSIANSERIGLSKSKMLDKTNEVIKNTSDNYSSMFQSIKKTKKTEIDSINGKLIEIGKKHNISTMINQVLVYCIKSL